MDVSTTTFKVVVAGPFAAGKTTFISHLADGPVVTTEAAATGHEAGVKAHTTVSLDYGRLRIEDPAGDVELLLFGTPGQERFRFMVDVAVRGMDGFVLVVDGRDERTWGDAADILGRLRQGPAVPWLVGVNRSDGVAHAAGLASALGPDASGRTRPMDARVRDSVVAVALDLLLEIGEELAGLEPDLDAKRDAGRDPAMDTEREREDDDARR